MGCFFTGSKPRIQFVLDFGVTKGFAPYGRFPKRKLHSGVFEKSRLSKKLNCAKTWIFFQKSFDTINQSAFSITFREWILEAQDKVHTRDGIYELSWVSIFQQEGGDWSIFFPVRWGGGKLVYEVHIFPAYMAKYVCLNSVCKTETRWFGCSPPPG